MLWKTAVFPSLGSLRLGLDRFGAVTLKGPHLS